VDTADGAAPNPTPIGPGPVADDWTAPAEAPLPPVPYGPSVLDADSWEEYEGSERSVDTYEGRRRAATSSMRVWLVTAVILVGLGAVIAIPLALINGTHGAEPAAAASTKAVPPAGGPTAPGASLVPATGAPPAAPATTTRPPGPFSVTIEAEGPGTVLIGSARVVAYPNASNGGIVTDLGRGESDSGSLRFTVTLPSTGPYVPMTWGRRNRAHPQL